MKIVCTSVSLSSTILFGIVALLWNALFQTCQAANGPVFTTANIQSKFPDLVFANTTNDRWHSFSFHDGYRIFWRFVYNPSTDVINWNSNVTATQVEIILNTDFAGWMGIGFGSSTMLNADFNIVHRPIQANGSFALTYRAYDSVTYSERKIYSDTSLGGRNDLTTVGAMATGSSVAILYRRKTNTGDGNDYVLKPGRTAVVTAFGWSPNMAVHGLLRRNAFAINFYRDEKGFESSSLNFEDGEYLPIKNRSTAFIVFHIFVMVLNFAILVPFGLYSARFWLDPDTWLFVHKVVMGFAAGETVTVGIGSLLTGSESLDSYHSILGLTVSVAAVGVLLLGVIAEQEWAAVLMFHKYVRQGHRYLARVFYIACLVNCYFGILLLSTTDTQMLIALVTGFTGMLLSTCGLLFLFHKLDGINRILRWFENWKDMNRLKIKEASKDKGSALIRLKRQRTASTGSRHSVGLPEFSWTDIKVRVEKENCKWIVIDNGIYDVTEYMYLHPGGVGVIENFLGRDATNAFYPERAGQDKVKTTTAVERRMSLSLRRRTSVIGHVHSRLAQHRLRNYAVGTVQAGSGIVVEGSGGNDHLSPTKNQKQVLRSAALITTNNGEVSSLSNIAVQRPREKIRAVVESMEVVSKDIPNPETRMYSVIVKSLTRPFPSVTPGDSYRFWITVPASVRFADADTSDASDRKQDIGRFYTPIEAKGGQSIKFLIKVYSDGQFTAPFARYVLEATKEKPFEFEIEGPIAHQDDHPFRLHLGTSVPWNHIILIGAGSGVTPMLLSLSEIQKRNLSIKLNWISCHNNWAEAEGVHTLVKPYETTSNAKSFFFVSKEDKPVVDGEPAASIQCKKGRLQTVEDWDCAIGSEILQDSDPAKALILICGPNAFMKACKALLKEQLPYKNIFLVDH